MKLAEFFVTESRAVFEKYTDVKLSMSVYVFCCTFFEVIEECHCPLFEYQNHFSLIPMVAPYFLIKLLTSIRECALQHSKSMKT